MKEIMFIQYLVTITDLLKEKPYPIFSYLVVAIKHVFIQITSVTVFHDEIEIILAGNLYFPVVDKVGMRWKFLKHFEFSFVDSIIFFLSNVNNFAGQLFLHVFDVVGSDNRGSGTSTCNFLLDGIRRTL